MKAKIIFDGREHEVEITEEFALELTKSLPVEKKKTGYERVKSGKNYYRADYFGTILKESDNRCYYDEDCYNTANYYADKTLAENNARADKLYRQLRRFAVEHREKAIDWNDKTQSKYFIRYPYPLNEPCVGAKNNIRTFGGIYFDSEDTVQLAIDTFKDELMWYFTEYKDSL